MIKFLADLQQASSTPSQLRNMAFDAIDSSITTLAKAPCAFPQLSKIGLVFSDAGVHEYSPMAGVKNVPKRKIAYHSKRSDDHTMYIQWNGRHESYPTCAKGYMALARSRYKSALSAYWSGSQTQLAGLQIVPIDIERD
jgi:hypothetical protein